MFQRSLSPDMSRNYKYRRWNSGQYNNITKQATAQLDSLVEEATNTVSHRNNYCYINHTNFWDTVQNQAPSNFQLEDAQKWWLNTNRTLPDDQDELAMTANVISGSEFFRKQSGRPIHIIMKDHTRRSAPDHWNNTVFQSIIDQIETETNYPITKHYFIPNNGHEYHSQPTERCSTPTPPAEDDTTATIIIHTCHVNKDNLHSANKIPNDEGKRRKHLNYDIRDAIRNLSNPKKALDMEHVNVLHTFMKKALKDEQQFRIRMTNRTELMLKLNEEQEDGEKWPENVIFKYEENQEREREILGLIEPFLQAEPSYMPTTLVKQTIIMLEFYEVIEKYDDSDNYNQLTSLHYQTRQDPIQAICKSIMERNENQNARISDFIKKYNTSVRTPEGSSTVIEPGHRKFCFSMEDIKRKFQMTPIQKHFQANRDEQNPEVTKTKCICSKNNHLLNDYINHDNLDKKIQEIREISSKKRDCIFNKYKDYKCPCKHCITDEAIYNCKLMQCPCNKHLIEAMDKLQKDIANSACCHSMDLYKKVKPKLVMGLFNGPMTSIRSVLSEIVHDPVQYERLAAQLAVTKYEKERNEDPYLIQRATIASSIETSISSEDDVNNDTWTSDVPKLSELDAIDDTDPRNEPNKWNSYKCNTQRVEAIKTALRIRDKMSPDCHENSTCHAHCKCSECNSTCKCTPEQKKTSHLPVNQRFHLGIFEPHGLDVIDEKKIRTENNPDYIPRHVERQLMRTHKQPCRREYIEQVKTTMRNDIMESNRNPNFSQVNSTCSQYCTCPRCNSKCTCPNDRVRAIRHSPHQQIIFVPKPNDFEYWHTMQMLIIENYRDRERDLADIREANELKRKAGPITPLRLEPSTNDEEKVQMESI